MAIERRPFGKTGHDKLLEACDRLIIPKIFICNLAAIYTNPKFKVKFEVPTEDELVIYLSKKNISK